MVRDRDGWLVFKGHYSNCAHAAPNPNRPVRTSSSIVQKVLEGAHAAKLKFRVIVADSRPRLEGMCSCFFVFAAGRAAETDPMVMPDCVARRQGAPC